MVTKNWEPFVPGQWLDLRSYDMLPGIPHTRSSVCHAEQEWLSVLQFEVLILKLLAVNAFSSGTIASSKITTLNHERLDDAVETRSLVVEGNTSLALALLSGAESSEILGSLGNYIVVLSLISHRDEIEDVNKAHKLKGDTTSLGLANVDVEKDTTALSSCHCDRSVIEFLDNLKG